MTRRLWQRRVQHLRHDRLPAHEGRQFARGLGRLQRRLAAKLSARRGKRGEAHAERVLEKRGYQILGRQAAGTYTLQVDGQREAVELLVLGIGAAFWGLVAGIVVSWLLERRDFVSMATRAPGQ